MKNFSIKYHETYSRTYEIEANTPEEAEEILRERIGDGTENAPEECENSWCDNIYEMEKDSSIDEVFINEGIKHCFLTRNNDGSYKSIESFESLHHMEKCIYIDYDGTIIDYINKFAEYAENYDEIQECVKWIIDAKTFGYNINLTNLAEHCEYIGKKLINVAERLEALKVTNR